jgi:hypothetical protein
MAHDLTREDLKRNELGEAVEAGVHFAEHHVRKLLLALGAVGAAALLAWAIWGWRTSRGAAASAALGEALRVAGAEVVAPDAPPPGPAEVDRPRFTSVAARDARAKELFEDVASRYGSTGPGHAAKVWLGERAHAAGDEETARRLWQEVLADENDGVFAAAARLDLIRLERGAGRGEALVADLQRELDGAGGPLPADTLLAVLARTYETLGRTGDANAAWRRLLDEHADSAWAAEARQQLGPDAPAL